MEVSSPDDHAQKTDHTELPAPTGKKDNTSSGDENLYTTGWRLHIITLVLSICVFIAQMESTITSTSIITITDDLGGFEKGSWVLTAYWLTSGAFQIIWAKLSDIVGRKISMMTAIFLFAAFSGACGASQSVFQLIMFRWAQGIGGCGVLALGQFIFFELVPPPKYPAYTALVTSVIAGSLVTGPLIGGGITLDGNWRWVFLINVPIGVTALLALGLLFPRLLWNEPAANASSTSTFGRQLLTRLDILGTVLLLGSCLLLTTGLEQAAIGYSFNSVFVLPLLICSGPFIVAFFTWQWFITTRRTQPDPVFPWRFCQKRVRISMIIISWLSGGVVSTCVFQIPQRFMTTNGMSPFSAAVRLLAFGAFVPAGSGLTGVLLGRLRIRPVVVIAIGAALQLAGTVPLSRSSSEFHVHPSQYGFQILVGIGLGLVMPALIYLLPFAMEKRDLAVGTATISQFRILGGLIAVASGTSITTRNLRASLARLVPPELVARILERTEDLRLLPADSVGRARELFGQGYNLHMDLGVGLAAAQMLFTALMWTKREISR